MPLLILTLVAAVVLGLTTARRTAMLGTTGVALLSLITFVWTVADGRGQDPPWLLVVPVAVGSGAVWLAGRLSRNRRRGEAAA